MGRGRRGPLGLLGHLPATSQHRIPASVPTLGHLLMTSLVARPTGRRQDLEAQGRAAVTESLDRGGTQSE